MPGFLLISFKIAFTLSSNCPLYFVPATSEPTSRVIIVLSFNTLDTFSSAILIANPSAIADLPTPGSPISTGLFFFLLPNICASLSISLSLPTTGSSLPSFAAFVRLNPKLSNTGVEVVLFFCSVIFISLVGFSTSTVC